jgi:flagellar biosynthesis anti-sigma factor FlgM
VAIAVSAFIQAVSFLTAHMERNRKMVDSVTFGPARLAPGLRASGAAEAAPKRENSLKPAAPHSLSLATALAQKGPPYDAEKVASLRAALASGTYKVDLGAVADGIIRFGGQDLG